MNAINKNKDEQEKKSDAKGGEGASSGVPDPKDVANIIEMKRGTLYELKDSRRIFVPK